MRKVYEVTLQFDNYRQIPVTVKARNKVHVRRKMQPEMDAGARIEGIFRLWGKEKRDALYRQKIDLHI